MPNDLDVSTIEVSRLEQTESPLKPAEDDVKRRTEEALYKRLEQEVEELKTANERRAELYRSCTRLTKWFAGFVVALILVQAVKWDKFHLEPTEFLGVLGVFTVSCFAFLRAVMRYHFPDSGTGKKPTAQV